MIKKLLSLFKMETVRYLFIGACTTAVNFIVFALFYNLLDIALNTSNFIAISAAIIFAFFTNKSFVFLDKSNSFKKTLYAFVLFIAGRLFTMIIEIFGTWLMVEFFCINAYFSKFFIQIIVLIANYIISKFFIFKKEEE